MPLDTIDLDLKESYIKYLENKILIRDRELDSLRQEIFDIKEWLEKTLRDSESRENYIDYLEKQLVIFQDKIDKLNEKIKILILYKNGNDNIDSKNYNLAIDMAQQPESPRLSLPENQATIQNNRIQREINNIRQYFQSLIIITPTINDIVDYLNIISDAGDRFERLVLDIYPQANACAIYAENQVADLQTQLTNSQIQLATLQNDYDLLHQAYEAHRTQHNIFKSRELDR
ncbi:20673_t:CDS:2 [Cetraspora pellucida]|uniref:20673_t:CDS:1 n=1 Tax=Cetraspora pellucida TaxID=1433469 RepID=A0A9N9C668_9GLOM|nr:20673_t:CDS:2 [Cetraspora pellucida]